MKKLLWCSPHTPTAEQMQELVGMGHVQLLNDVNSDLQRRINNCPANRVELSKLACELGQYAQMGYTLVQPGGSPKFQFMLGICNAEIGIDDKVLYAHSERVSIDTPQVDGTIVKTSVFKHLGFN